jgi:hypothetical protein
VGVVERGGVAARCGRGGSAGGAGAVHGRHGEAHGGGFGEDGGEAWGGAGGSGCRHDAGQLDAARTYRAVSRIGRGNGPAGRTAMFVDRRGHRGMQDWRVAVRRPRRHGSGALAPVAAVAELVVVKATCELRLLQVGGDMLVRHLLHSRLEKISFLIFAPGSPTACGGRLSILGNAIIVTIHSVRPRCVWDVLPCHLHSRRHPDPISRCLSSQLFPKNTRSNLMERREG